MKRCNWAESNELEMKYHDEEWGVPITDDRALFECLILEGAQSGLSWATILAKRDGYRKAFNNFEAKKIAKYTETKIEKLLVDERIVRNKLKIRATVQNAKSFLLIQKEFGSFSHYIWSFVNYKPIDKARKTRKSVPSVSPESEKMSQDLKKRGFKFIGPTTCYAFMQAVGMVNDHVVTCFRYKEVKKVKVSF